MTTRAITFYGTTIGKKVVMAVSGLVGFGFLVGHLAGNLLVFAGAEAVNEYSRFLHESKGLLWGTRIALTAAVAAHVHAAFSLWARNNEARPRAYYQRKDLATNYAARTMRYGGVVLLSFIVFHLLHLTFGQTQGMGYEFDPENVYNNIIFGFMNPAVSAAYIVAQIALGMHLYHGIWSLTQTLGGDHPKYNQKRQLASASAALIIVLGFISIPISVLTETLTPVATDGADADDAAE